MAAWFSSTGISIHSLLPHVPSVCLSTVNCSPRSGIAPQSLVAPSCCAFQGTHVLARGVYGWGMDCLMLITFRLPQIRCFTLSLKCFSFGSDNCPGVGIGPLLQFPHPLRAGPVLVTLLFSPLVPLSYWVVCGSVLFGWSGTPLCSQLVFCMHFLAGDF